MTLVAAFHVNEIPMLIGDMVLTNGPKRSLQKKVYVISPNFAIAWAGSWIAAKMVIRELRNEFLSKSVTKENVENFLKNYYDDDFGTMHTNFIGWIIEDKSYCFRWNCLYPQEIFYDDHFIDGSGEEYFKNLKNQGWESGDSTLPKQDDAIVTVINEIAQARFEESLYQGSWDLSFGASYDILAFIAGQFRYIRSIIYIGWDYHWDSALGTGQLQQAPVVIKYNCFGEYSVIQEALHGNYYDGKTTNYLSPPVYDPSLINRFRHDLSNFPFSLNSDYFANYFIFRENGKTPFKILLTIQSITEEGPLKIRMINGAYFFDYDTKELDQIYLKHRLSSSD